VLQNFQPGVNSLMSRNENYFRQPAYLESVEVFAIADDNARVNAVMSGDIQMGANIKPTFLRMVEGQSGFALNKNTAGNYTDLNVRLDMSPGDKAGFAEGIKYLLDRETIQRSALRGQAEIGNDQPIPPMSPYHNAELKPREYDPERAKSLFEKAGVLGQRIEVISSDAATSANEMAMILQQAGAQIGMNFDIQRVPADGYWSNYWLKAPIHFGNINPRPTPDILFSLLYKSDAAWNESQYKSEKFDSMLVEARGELEFTRRKEIYDEMQVMVSNEAATAIPVFLTGVDLHTDKLHGVRPNPLGGMTGFAFAEYAWLSE